MSDRYVEVTTKSWGSRIAGSFAGVLAGLFLFVAAFPLIVWNEGRSVNRIKTLGEGRASVVEAVADQVDGAHNGALVHVSGLATTSDVLNDSQFGVSEAALKLRRTVEMYQWKENSESHTTKNVGGSETTETVYTYEKVWSSSHISSSGFKKALGHENPAQMPFQSQQLVASSVTLGAYKLGSSFVSQINDADSYLLGQKNLDAMDPALKSSFVLNGNSFFRGNPANPQVGAVRVSFGIVRPTQVSVIGKQDGDALQTFATRNGTINLLDIGTVSAGDMFAEAESENKLITWLIRLAAFAMMWIGLSLVMGPISVIGSVIPFIGSILGAGAGFVAFVLALALSTVTMALAWIAFRPVIGIGLLTLAALIFFGGFKWLRGKAQAAAPVTAGGSPQFGRPPA